MRKSIFREHQIIRVLKEAEGGRPVKDVCREYGVSPAKWKSRYEGMEASDVRKLKDLEGEIGG